jgi:hypothetical protein
VASIDSTGSGRSVRTMQTSIAICFIVQGWPTKRRGNQPSVPASIRFRRMRDCHSAFSGFGRRGAPEERAGSGFDSCRAPDRAESRRTKLIGAAQRGKSERREAERVDAVPLVRFVQGCRVTQPAGTTIGTKLRGTREPARTRFHVTRFPTL